VLGKVGDMQAKRTSEPAGSPDPEPVPVNPDVEQREARRTARSASREARGDRPGVMIPDRRKRLPLEAPLMRVVASAGIAGIAVVVAAIMGSQGSEPWLIGLVASLISLILAAVLWSSRRL
jgi:hypothetical protein